LSHLSQIGDNSHYNVVIQGDGNHLVVIINGRVEVSKTWFENNLSTSISNLGVRYSPELNVSHPLNSCFKNLTRSNDSLKAHIKKLLNNIDEKRAFIKRPTNVFDESQIHKLDESIQKLVDWYNSLDLFSMKPLKGNVEQAIEKLNDSISELEDTILKKGRESRQETDFDKVDTVTRDLYSYLNSIARLSRELEEFVNDKDFSVLDNPFVLLKGDAGQGKSHLLADVCLSHQNSGGASILLLGSYFNDSEQFWHQVLQILGVSTTCTKDDFLTALNAYAQTSGKRLLFCIDAINEGKAKTIWSGILSGIVQDLKRYEYLSLVISVRTCYLSFIVPENLSKEIITIEHLGFTGIEYNAIKAFFSYYKLNLPNIPILNPEFGNPLFLKLYCLGLQNTDTQISTGEFPGISKIVNLFLDGINQSLQKKYQVPLKLKIAQKCTDIFSKALIESKAYHLPFDQSFKVLDKSLKTFFSLNSFPQEGILQLFISEGVLRESRTWSYQQDEQIDVVEFNYERFGDQKIADYLIDNYLSKNINALKENEDLFYISESPYSYQSLMSSLAIAIPERFGFELFEVMPENERLLNSSYDAYFESLKWRKYSSIQIEKYNHVAKNHSNVNISLFLEIVLTISVRINHPLNINFLHERLLKLSLEERDDFWTKSLYHKFSKEANSSEDYTFVQRLIDWTWAEGSNKDIKDDGSIILIVKTITWLLSSPNKNLRDSATKGLVKVLTNRLELAITLIDDFKDVNDAYIIERLYAAIYGARTQSTNGCPNLSQKIYDLYYKDGTPPIHFMTRDYLRKYLEFSIIKEESFSYEKVNIAPPYKSVWSFENIMTEEELKSKYIDLTPEDKHNPNSRVLDILYNNVFSDFYDFNKHKLQDHSLRFTTKSITAEQKFDFFINSLSINKRKRINSIKELYNRYNTLKNNPTRQNIHTKIFIETFDEYSKSDFDLERLLSRGELENYRTEIVPYFEDLTDTLYPIGLQEIKCFILQRVFDLGWTANAFGMLDQFIQQSFYRTDTTRGFDPFYIKYIEIAYNECLARMSDNFYFQTERYSDSKDYNILSDPSDLYNRDIDPTIEPLNIDKEDNWWIKEPFFKWDIQYSEWIRLKDDLPQVDELVVLKDVNNEEWLMLKSLPVWRETLEYNYKGHDLFGETSSKEAWFLVIGSVIERKGLIKFIDWAKKQDFRGRWVNEGLDPHSIYNQEYHFTEQYINYVKESKGIKKLRPLLWENLGKNCPIKGLVTSETYHWSNSEDFSLIENISFLKPSLSLVNLFNLTTLNGYDFYNDQKQLVCFDPSVKKGGKSCLLINKKIALDLLAKKDLTIVWTIQGEKIGHPDYQTHGRMDISGYYYFDEEGNIVGSLQSYTSPD
jgi:hypothetical protein